MRVSNNSQIRFSGIEIIPAQLVKGNVKKVVDSLDNLTLSYVNPLLHDLEKNAGADILVKITPDEKINLSLVRTYVKKFDDFEQTMEEITVPLVSPRGRKIETTINAQSSESIFMSKLQAFLKKCKTYLAHPDNPKNMVLDQSEDIYCRYYDLPENNFIKYY